MVVFLFVTMLFLKVRIAIQIMMNSLDLPKLHTIFFVYGHNSLEGDCGDDREVTINEYESYDNTLIMKSILTNY